jgi:Zinc knuckle
MDIDVTTTQSNRTPDPDHENLICEGCCFYCKEQGHLSRECPKKKKQNTAGTTRARVTETSEVTATTTLTSSNKPTNEEVAKTLKAMSDEECGKLAKSLSQDPSF